MDADRLRIEIGTAVRSFIAGVVLHNQAVAQKLGLGGSDAQFLQLLQVHGPLTPGRLAELSGLTTGTVTGVIDRLERVGFVRRTRDAGDRRKVLVTPEPQWMQSLYEHYQAHGEHMEAVLRRRGPDELRVIAGFLDDLNASPSPSGAANPSGDDESVHPPGAG